MSRLSNATPRACTPEERAGDEDTRDVSADERIERFVVTKAESRLDRALVARFSEYSRAEVQRWIREGAVRVDGGSATPSTSLRPGSVVEVKPASAATSTAVAEAIEIDVRFEDDALLVVNKPAGMVVHPAAGHRSGTLVNAVLHHTRVEDDCDPARPGVVHRLDKQTSGLLVIAKDPRARASLVAQFQARTVVRRYDAIVLGTFAERATYQTFYGRDPRSRLRFTGRLKQGKHAVTHAVREAQLSEACLIACKLETGRTHQIRVHLSEAGFPILGDALYGRTPPREPLGHLHRSALEAGYHYLHAATLGFMHPVSGEALAFEAERPAYFGRALDALKL